MHIDQLIANYLKQRMAYGRLYINTAIHLQLFFKVDKNPVKFRNLIAVQHMTQRPRLKLKER